MAKALDVGGVVCGIGVVLAVGLVAVGWADRPALAGAGAGVGLVTAAGWVVRAEARRRRAEHALRESRERFALAVRGSNDGLWDWDLVADAAYHSDRMAELLGFAPGEFEHAYAAWESRLHPDDRDRVLACLQGHLDDDQPFDVDYRMRTRDGEYRWFNSRGQALRDATGRAVRIAGSFTDVTERRRAVEALEQREQEFRALFESAAVGMAQVSATTGRFTQVNDKFCALLGYTREELLLRGPANLQGSIEYALTPARLAALARGEEPDYAAEKRFIRKDGSILLAETTATAVRDAAGRPTHTILVIHDVTARRAAEAALARARDELEQRVEDRTRELAAAKSAAEAASRAKSEFLASMSHEIRTPMNGILGMTDLVLGTRLDPEQREFLGLVKASADRLLRIINDILDFSKAEAGRLELTPAPFALRELAGAAVRMFVAQAAEKKVELTCRVAPDTPRGVVGDAGRITQILVNLIGNAVKFTDRGEVRVEVEPVGRGPWGVELRVTVADTGVGIPPGQQAAIFEAFVQGSADPIRQRGGTGLGLAISALLVARMGGRIWVESEPGRGSTFRFTVRLPEAELGPPVETASRLVRLKGGRALVVDDNPSTRRILVETVQTWGMSADEADSGPAALAALEQAHQTRRPFRVVLADVGRAGLDGFAVARHVRDHPDRATAVVLLVAGSRAGDLGRARAQSITAVLKPISPSDLFQVVWRAVAVGGLDPAGDGLHEETPPLAPSALRPLRVLVAEDQVVNQRLILRLLTDGGHQPTLAQDGQEALDRLAAEAFDVVLMDVHMPVLDGLTATARLREREREAGRHTRVIALTAYAQPADRERCLAAGCDGYLAKPIRKADLYAALDAGHG